MKVTLSTLLALALSGALLSGCDRPVNQPATGARDQAATGGTKGEKQQDPRTNPNPPSAPVKKP